MRLSHMFRQAGPAFFGIFALTALISATSLRVLLAQVEAPQGDTNTTEPQTPAQQESEPVERPRTYEKPPSIRTDEREDLERKYDEQERLGEEIQRAMEAQGDVVGEGKSFEEIKAEAEARLNTAAQSHAEDQPEGGEPHAATPDASAEQTRVCFTVDNTVTSDESSCDPDQSRHFGFAEENKPDEGHAIPSSEEVFDSVSEDFTTQVSAGGSVLTLISEALTRLSGMIPSMNGNPPALAKIQEAIQWLSGLLTQHDAGQLSPSQETELAQQIRDRLSAIAALMGKGNQERGMMRGKGEYGGPNMQMILTMLEKMMEKLPKVFAIFKEEGIPIAQEALDAYAQGMALFRELQPQCVADKQKCSSLKDVIATLERMRPPMEKAMMESGKMEVGMRIHKLMDEGMEGMPMEGSGPSGGHEGYGQFGPPPGSYPSGTYDMPPPSGSEPSGQ